MSGTVSRLGWRRVAAVMSVAALVAAVCVVAGLWQWSRHTDRSAQVALVRENLTAATADVTDVLQPDGSLPADAVWRHAQVRGRYVGDPVLLRNRPIGSGPGYHVLGVVRVEDPPLADRLLVVDRGFLAGELDAGAELDVPAPPTGPVSLVVRVRADEPGSARSAPAGQVQAVNVAQVLQAASSSSADGGAALPWYGIVRAEDGAAPAGLVPLPSPTTDLGSHLSYTFQWWIFAIGALVGGVILLRREAAADEQDEDARLQPASSGTVGTGRARGRTSSPHARAGATSPPSGRRRRPTAEEEEDALLDAQSPDR